MSLSIVPAETSIYAGDSLLVKGEIQNRGKTPVTLPRPFDAPWAGIRFEVCPPRQSAYEQAYALGGGKKCGRSNGVEIKAGTSIVCYEHLFWDIPPKAGPIFSAPGKWRLRALVTIDGKEIASEPVTLNVVEPPQRMKKALEQHTDSIELALLGWRLSGDQMKSALEARDQLELSNAGRAVAHSYLLHELTRADSAKAKQFAMTAVTGHRATLRPVAREYFDLLTASAMCDRKEYVAAKKLLDAIPEHSHKRDSLLYRLPADVFEQGK